MEDPTTPSSRDPPTAPSSPVVPGHPGVPFASFELASAHVQGRFHDAYAFAKRFGDQPLHAHTLTGQLPASARSSEVVRAALKSLGAKTRSVEQERDAWRAKYEDAQRELREVIAERDEQAAKRAEEARRHRDAADESAVDASPSPRTETVRARVRRIEGSSNVVHSVISAENDAVSTDGAVTEGATRVVARRTTASASAYPDTRPEKRNPEEVKNETDETDADAAPSVAPSRDEGRARADLEAATRRAETAEAALRAAEAARASDAMRATAHSEISALKTQLAAARAEHAVRLEELDASWSARLRLSRGGVTASVSNTREDPQDPQDPRDSREDHGTHDARESNALRARVRELESVVAALISTTSRAPKARAKKKPSRRNGARVVNVASRLSSLAFVRSRNDATRTRGASSRLSRASDEWESDASEEWDERDAARDSGGVGVEPARRARGRETPAATTRRKPWGSGFSTNNADGALGLSPLSSRANARDHYASSGPDDTHRRVPDRAKHAVRLFRPPPRPPFRGAAKQKTAAATPMAVARAAGGFSYPEDATAEKHRRVVVSHRAEHTVGGDLSKSDGARAGPARGARRRTESVVRRVEVAAAPAAPRSSASVKSDASGVSGVSGVSRARSMEALKRARAAAKRRGATVAAARSGSVFSSPAASLAPSPAASPARPAGRGAATDDASLAALRAAFEATREEYSRLALGVIGEDSGAALDDVIERLRDVSAEIARRVQPAR